MEEDQGAHEGLGRKERFLSVEGVHSTEQAAGGKLGHRPCSGHPAVRGVTITSPAVARSRTPQASTSVVHGEVRSGWQEAASPWGARSYGRATRWEGQRLRHRLGSLESEAGRVQARARETRDVAGVGQPPCRGLGQRGRRRVPGALACGCERGRRPEAAGAGPLGGAWVPAPAGRAGSRVGAAGADWLAGARAGRAAAARRGRSPRSLASASAARRRAPPARPPPPVPPAGGHHEHRPAVQEQAGDPRPGPRPDPDPAEDKQVRARRRSPRGRLSPIVPPTPPAPRRDPAPAGRHPALSR
ncbi:translation initiation factor IF-2-like [Panthera pardus]|uniref:Translation initiation factor IF-2-like n=1 Tax=Panthera pardus TaxID=9691 RepID=A0A9W2VKK7_PANPR|nr:translation initiation factor IF-2-like [Panthera pardus]